jgi:hypothetical protein
MTTASTNTNTETHPSPGAREERISYTSPSERCTFRRSRSSRGSQPRSSSTLHGQWRLASSGSAQVVVTSENTTSAGGGREDLAWWIHEGENAVKKGVVEVKRGKAAKKAVEEMSSATWPTLMENPSDLETWSDAQHWIVQATTARPPCGRPR